MSMASEDWQGKEMALEWEVLMLAYTERIANWDHPAAEYAFWGKLAGAAMVLRKDRDEIACLKADVKQG